MHSSSRHWLSRLPVTRAQASAALTVLSLMAMVLGSLACERFR